MCDTLANTHSVADTVQQPLLVHAPLPIPFCLLLCMQRLSCAAAKAASPSTYYCPSGYNYIGTDTILFTDFTKDCCQAQAASVSAEFVILPMSAVFPLHMEIGVTMHMRLVRK